jgi:hypothetical protein
LISKAYPITIIFIKNHLAPPLKNSSPPPSYPLSREVLAYEELANFPDLFSKVKQFAMQTFKFRIANLI